MSRTILSSRVDSSATFNRLARFALLAGVSLFSGLSVPAFAQQGTLVVSVGLAFLGSVVSFACCLQCRRPPQQVINHRLGLCLKLGESFVHVAALEMRPKGRNGNVDGRANRGDLNLYHGFPELLDATRAHGAAIAYESSRFAVRILRSS